jgi:twitching motility protein PilI
MSRAARLDLRTFQQELALRLAKKTTAQVESSRLGFASNGGRWLIRLADAGEVVTVPPIVSVPMTQPWFLGVTNIRGNLYSVVDFPAFLQRKPVVLNDQSRLLLLGERFRLGTALLIDRSLGLRNPAQLERRQGEPGVWSRAQYADAEGRLWKELDLPQLAQHPDFLGVGVK